MQPALYLFFPGTCFEAMSHYAAVLGGEIGMVMRNSDAPDEESRMPGGDDMVMHMQIAVGGVRIMASDSPSEMYSAPQGFRVQIETASLEEFERVFEALSAGAKAVEMPPEKTFWAERFAMFTDKYGTPWMLDFENAEG